MGTEFGKILKNDTWKFWTDPDWNFKSIYECAVLIPFYSDVELFVSYKRDFVGSMRTAAKF